MHGTDLRQALGQRQRVYGVSMEGYGTPRWPRGLARLGLDFVFLDSEHSPNDRETIAWASQAYAANNVAPLVRIPEISAAHASQVLDGGAHGVIVPYVETVEHVKEITGAVKYRPLKGEALDKVLNEGVFPNDETQEYLDVRNAHASTVIMIESPAGVANLPDILDYGHVDGVLIGPHDLSTSHGVPEQYHHPIFLDAVKSIFRTCEDYGVSGGIHFTNDAMGTADEWVDLGATLLVYRSDGAFVMRGIQTELNPLRAKYDGIEESKEIIGASGHGD